ncbi:Osmoprotectant ABC transporter binding proteinYehZ [Salmonella enterica subsp. diarizonae]|uniref:Osmoprotectant ABC transporter binding proteinYehZ n=1 Tax=Salmonella diarizonae TaxID=59204 RepID=A0A379TWG4_SALDZ|nr:Osmoprotectant ABC transporter binding proteinYehZ [Salmonella enterica subsp. diarizonae]
MGKFAGVAGDGEFTSTGGIAVTVGSKIDTEGALLGNMILQVLEGHGVKTVNKIQLGTTPVVRGAITAGELDIYPEYTGNGAFFLKMKTIRHGRMQSKALRSQKTGCGAE